MNKAKAIICTAAMTLMLVIIMAGLALLRYWLALLVLVGFFAALGLALTSGKLYDWLAGETREPELPELVRGKRKRKPKVKVFEPEPETAPEEVVATVEDILAEMGSVGVG